MVDEDQYEIENYGAMYPLQRFEEEVAGAFPRPLTTAEVARRVACTPPTAREKLESLRRHGVIDRTTVGNGTHVYYLAVQGSGATAPAASSSSSDAEL